MLSLIYLPSELSIEYILDKYLLHASWFWVHFFIFLRVFRGLAVSSDVKTWLTTSIHRGLLAVILPGVGECEVLCSWVFLGLHCIMETKLGLWSFLMMWEYYPVVVWVRVEVRCRYLAVVAKNRLGQVRQALWWHQYLQCHPNQISQKFLTFN